MTSEDAFLCVVASRKLVRPSVRAIVVRNGNLLVQKPVDDPLACFAFIGGEYEHGDTFDSRIRREFEEETTAKVLSWHYLFVVENRFISNGAVIHGLEHYLEIELDRSLVESKEAHLAQYWLPVSELSRYDLRPAIVRDAIQQGNFHSLRHLRVELS